MVDTVSVAKRSEIMAKIRGKNTKPELQVRAILRALKVPYRLHSKTIPGRPDIVIAPIRTVICVNGCFWHNHTRCHPRIPVSAKVDWRLKVTSNAHRDVVNGRNLRKLG